MAFRITKAEAERFCKANEKFKTICPRCGKKMSEYPALSRYADIKICSECGTDEALMGFVGIENDFSEWKLGRK